MRLPRGERAVRAAGAELTPQVLDGTATTDSSYIAIAI
jgi:hypothetical protein